MLELKFKYNIDELIRIIPTNECGVIAMIGYDDAGNQYFVKSSNGSSNWWKEKHLIKENNNNV